MQTRLSQMVRQIRASTDSISHRVGEIATGNQDLSARTEQTASNLQQAASSMEQLTGTVKQSADSARQANQLALVGRRSGRRGGTVVSQVVTHDGRDQRELEEDRRHHRRDRRHRLPDQHPRAERGGRSGTRRRTRPRLRGRGPAKCAAWPAVRRPRRRRSRA
jgi:hypothetical protein